MVENMELLNLLELQNTSMKSASAMTTHSVVQECPVNEKSNGPTELQVKNTSMKSASPMTTHSVVHECPVNEKSNGSTNRMDSIISNGIEIKKIKSRYYITAINSTILCKKFPDNTVHVGNEVLYHYQVILLFLIFIL